MTLCLMPSWESFSPEISCENFFGQKKENTLKLLFRVFVVIMPFAVAVVVVD